MSDERANQYRKNEEDARSRIFGKEHRLMWVTLERRINYQRLKRGVSGNWSKTFFLILVSRHMM